MNLREAILIIAAIVGVLIELRKLHVSFMIISIGMLAGISLWILGIETVETSIFFGFVLLAFLVAVFQPRIDTGTRWVVAIIAAFVFAGEVSMFMKYPLEQYLRYAMIIPVGVFIAALGGKPKVTKGWGCLTIMAVDAAYIFLETVF
ncbi:MAG: hypothetical protein U5L09_15340 [Bacteroidales bacterium]|nr:hypothetical protein [Bacteroidales bacterium]